MSPVMVRYKVKPEEAARNEALIRDVYAEIDRDNVEGIHYATFVSEDGVSFVHIASNETKNGQNPLMKVAAFQAFQENINDRCDEPPARSELREVGSFGFWGK